MKKILIASAAAALAFTACSSSSSADGEGSSADTKGFIARFKAEYEIDKSAKTITYSEPACVEEDGKLVWSRNGEKETYSYEYDDKTGRITVDYDGEDEMYSYSGSNFPKGVWRDAYEDEENNTVASVEVYGDKVVEAGIIYSGNCFLKDIFMEAIGGEFGEGLDMMEGTEITCDKITVMKDYTVEIISWSKDEVKAKYTYGKESCTNSSKPRFAYNESDCKAAYADYKNSKEDEKFEFEDYPYTQSNPKCTEDFTNALLMAFMGGLLGGEGGFDFGDFDFGDFDPSTFGKKLARSLTNLKVSSKK